MADFTPFFVDRAKGSRASCKVCKNNCVSGELRIAKLVASPYGEGQQMKSWHHVECFMNVLLKQRPATKRIESIDDIGNWDTLTKDDQNFLLKKINEMEQVYAQKNDGKYTAKVIKNEYKPLPNSSNTSKDETDLNISKSPVKTSDNMFSSFIKLCKRISRVDAYTDKTAAVNSFFTNGCSGNKFEGDLVLWCKLLLPQVSKRVYNLKSKQLVKLFSRIFNTDHDDMLTHLEQGDVADTIQNFFSKSKSIMPASESTVTIHVIEDFLQELSKLTREDEQIYQFKKIVKRCTLDDLKMLIRLIKGDLRINAGPKHILEGVHPDAYQVFQTSRDLDMVLDRVLSQSIGVKQKGSILKSVQAKLSLMTPVLPMLAEACKSIEMAMKKCPNGMFSEIKYDGERVQVHKKGKEFKYFSRALKPVMAHKVSHFKDYLPQAFPKGEDMILDAEVLMVDVNTGKPLPFGTLGIHKQNKFKGAQVCLYVFDCLYYNGSVLMDMPIRKRRQILQQNMVEVTNHVKFSEQKLIEKPADLAKMIAKVLKLGLEGLVLKDLESIYEPGKRHWLKVKKDYLFDGAMADTADLVVLGAWFGSGKKGGMMSIFLMGCFDTHRKQWVAVTKVHTGHDDNTLERLQKELSPLMVKISQDSTKTPSWLDCNKGLIPDFVAKDPKKQPVWEITGTELTQSNLHTTNGVSVRFPRVTRIRDDKDWETATTMEELRNLYKASKEKTDVSLLEKLATAANDESPNKGKIDSFVQKISPKSPAGKKRKVIEEEISPQSEKRRRKEDPNASTSSTSSETISFNETDSTDTQSFSLSSALDSSLPKKAEKCSPTKGKIDSFMQKISPKSPGSRKRKGIEEQISPQSEKRKREKDLNVSNSSGTISFDETDSKDTQSFSLSSILDNPLPDAFKDKRLGFYPDFISFSEHERRHFERHWIAYGGEVVKSIKYMDVDYVVHRNNEIKLENMLKLKKRVPRNIIHVNKSWLIKCINEVKLCDTTKFPVFLKS